MHLQFSKFFVLSKFLRDRQDIMRQHEFVFQNGKSVFVEKAGKGVPFCRSTKKHRIRVRKIPENFGDVVKRQSSDFGRQMAQIGVVTVFQELFGGLHFQVARQQVTDVMWPDGFYGNECCQQLN